MIKSILKKIGLYKYLITAGLFCLRLTNLNKVRLNIQGIIFWTDYSTIASERAFNQDPELRDEMAGFINFSRSRGSLLDVGAYHGVFSLIFTKINPEGKAFAFEPSPKAHKVLTMNIRYNPTSQIEESSLAIGHSLDEISMQFEGEHIVASDHGKRVDQVSIDYLVYNKGYQFDTVKIDVEGYELNVLRGGQKFLQEFDPIIFLEIHPQRLTRMNASTEDVLTFLNEAGYRFFDNSGYLLDVSKKINEFRIICSKNKLGVN